MFSNRTVELVLIGGLAGCGKTSLGKELARLTGFAFYDKDTLTGRLVEGMLQALGSRRGAHDRDSELYAAQVRPVEYACFCDALVENVGLGISTVGVAPFLQELTDWNWRSKLEQNFRTLDGEVVRIHCVWIRAADDTMRRRLIERGSGRDTGKLGRWDEYLDKVRGIRPAEPYLEVDCSMDGPVRPVTLEMMNKLGLDKTMCRAAC